MLSKLHMGHSDLKDYSKNCCVGSSSNKQGTQIPNKKIRYENIWCNDMRTEKDIKDSRTSKGPYGVQCVWAWRAQGVREPKNQLLSCVSPCWCSSKTSTMSMMMDTVRGQCCDCYCPVSCKKHCECTFGRAFGGQMTWGPPTCSLDIHLLMEGTVPRVRELFTEAQTCILDQLL